MSAVMTAELIGTLEYVSVLVKDQDAALAFYRDVLGFEVSDDDNYGSGQAGCLAHQAARPDWYFSPIRRRLTKQATAAAAAAAGAAGQATPGRGWC
jgi:catechol 2,3-dioxygenase-like lactoylglutathione lyase family enzyme